MNHTAFFGDATYTFALTDDMILELEHKTAIGIGALYRRVVSADFRLIDITEIIRLGLIGGGTSPAAAKRLVDAYAINRPFDETFPMALDILDARWTGTPAAPVAAQDEINQAAASGDMSAAISETMKEAGL